MKNLKVNVEKLEKLQAPHLLCFAAGIGVVVSVVALT